jgi:XTP/dITP diphosphohydrolase
VEAKAKELGKELKDMTLEEMDRYWNEAKLSE